ncbi:MAG: protein glxC [Rhodococcus sp. (in: high G+C Gram-positive bacteria)]|uniref:GltB/FmdC/FwdC-like GXGXG domain-containing protein n=1 Tax=Rhodococcus sp. TaxID=1831 RepID=UPI003BB1C67C
MAPVATTETITAMTVLDLATSSTRAVNERLTSPEAPKSVTITGSQGAHALACGLDSDIDVTIEGHVGYYCAGMNQQATVTVTGNAGVGVGENMMSGTVHVKGDASQSAGATAHGGLLVIDGNAAARCGISMKGVDIVVGGNIGHMSAFMGQAGRLVVLGDAGEALGDSLYEARIYVRGTVASLGADCIKKEMREEHLSELRELLAAAGFDADPSEFTRYGSARQLYNFHVDNASAY